MRHDQAKDYSPQKYLETSSEDGILVHFEARSRGGLHFYQKRSHAVVLYNTRSAEFIEKAVCMKTKEELYHNVCFTPRLQRVVLKPNSYGGQQDQQEQDARISGDHLSGSSSCRETWSNNVDYRISGTPLSVFEKQDLNRKDKVKALIQQFENHPNKESFPQELKQTEKINKFSVKSRELIADMNNSEIFECEIETSFKRQCSDCNLYWEVGIVYCTCGRCLKPSQRIKAYNKDDFDVLSIPGCVVGKIHTCGATHGSSERQQKHSKAREMLQKSSSTQAWKTEIHTRKMAEKQPISKFPVTHRMDRGANYWI